MNMPHFTADASLYTSTRTYQGAVSAVRSGAIIQLAVDFPYFDFLNRCGCADAYLACGNICSQVDPRGSALDGDNCMFHCRTSMDNCYADCDSRLLKVPLSVVSPLGR
jgi:hypothetical protein